MNRKTTLKLQRAVQLCPVHLQHGRKEDSRQGRHQEPNPAQVQQEQAEHRLRQDHLRKVLLLPLPLLHPVLL